MDELLFGSIFDLAARLRQRSISPVELVQTSLARIEKLDPQIGAFVDVAAERALAEANAIAADDPRPFAGIPMAVKANVAVPGMTVDHGSAFLADHRPDRAAYLVRRLRDAGFVIVGTTKLPEFAILPTTEPRHGGPARNPWDLERTPGGSSGGSAAAVAAGMVPLAHGNDGGGSLRIPAACCGLVGLKPSRGRISCGPGAGDSFLANHGVLTHTVCDTALMLDVLGGYEPGDATWAARPAEPFLTSSQRDPGSLRIAYTTENPLGIECVPEVLSALDDAVEMLHGCGHALIEAPPPLPSPRSLQTFVDVFGPMISFGVAAATAQVGRDPGEDDLEPLTRMVVDDAEQGSALHYLTAFSELQAIGRSVVEFFADYDLLLTPLLASRPLAIGELTGFGEDPRADLMRSGTFAPFTPLFNVSGQPALSVPVRFGDDGIPTSVQLVGRPLGEDTLLAVGTQIELARERVDNRPPVAR